MTAESSRTAFHPHKEVRIDAPSSKDSESTAIESEKTKKKKFKDKLNPQTWKWPAYLSWVPRQLNWQGLKPVIRCSIASWIVRSLSKSN
jgi:hypothetical protein